MPGLFDDIPSAQSSMGLFDDIPAWTNVNAGSDVAAKIPRLDWQKARSSDNVFEAIDPAHPRPTIQSDTIIPIGEAPPDWGTTPQAEANALNTSGAMDKATNAIKEIPGAAYTGLQAGSEGLGKYAGLAVGGAAGLFDDLIGTNTQEAVFKNLVQPYDQAEQYHDQELAKKGLLGQVAGGIAKGIPDLALAAASGGETAALKAAPYAETAAKALARNIADSVAPAVKMAAPLAEKAAADAYAQKIAEGGQWYDATGAALKAIGSTMAMSAAVPGEGPLLSRVAQGAVGAGATEESIRSLEGREFNPVEFGTALATGAGFGLAGHEAPHDALGEPVPHNAGDIDVSNDIHLNPDVSQVEQSKPRGRYNHETGRVEGLFDDLVPERPQAPVERSQVEELPRQPEAVETPQRAVQEPTEASNEPSVEELSHSDLTPAEMAAFERQTQRSETPPEDAFQNNASGESSASVEAINRIKDEKALGQTRLLIDKDGSVRPLFGVDAVDTFAKDGQVIVQRNIGKDEWTVLHADPEMSKDLVEGKLNASKPALAETANELIKEQATVPPTSTKNAVMEAERTTESRDPIVKEAVRSNPETLKAAQDVIAKNPLRADEVVERLNQEGPKAVSTEDEAVLLLEKTRLRNARDEVAKIASDESASEEARTAAKLQWEEHEAKINTIDQATSASGGEWGRFGQFRQRMLANDYTFEALERKERVREGRPLTRQESVKVKEMADRIQHLEKEAASVHARLDESKTTKGVKDVYDQLVKEMAASFKIAKTARKPTLERFKAMADESRDYIRKQATQLNAGIDPVAFFHLARIGAYHIANGAVKFAEWSAKMKAELGHAFETVKEALPKIFEASKIQHSAVKTDIPSVGEIVDRINGDITHKDVYDLARSHINSGTHGEDAVMKAVTKDLADHGVSERDVRRLFSQYGEVKFPSKEADKTELRELRTLVQLQESIDRIQEGADALKSGPQRDKPTQLVREKRAQLNDLLKVQETKNGLSPEKLASYQDARANNLRNQIEDLNKQISTGEKPVRKAAPAPNEEVIRLRSQRDALKDQLKAIEDAKNPPKSPEVRYQENRAQSLAKQLENVKQRIATNDYAKRTRPEHELNEANTKAQFELYKAKEMFTRHQFEAEMAKRSPLKKVFATVPESMNLARAIMTSFDLSAVLRQGGFIALGRPRIAAKSIMPMLRAAMSEKNSYKIQKEIEERPNARLYKKSKLDLTKDDGHALNKVEEAFMSRWIQRSDMKEGQPIMNAVRTGKNTILAPVRASERAFKTFLNKLRADSFDALTASLAKNGEKPTDAEIKAIANYINIATGRGKLGTNPSTAVGLNTVFFAPRLVASRFNLLAGQPMYGGTMRTRSLVAQEYARFLAGVGVVLALGAAAKSLDPKDKTPLVNFDPRSSDFLKMRFGDAYIDPMAGLGQTTTFLAREFAGETVSGKGDEKSLREDFHPLNYLREKPHPTKMPYRGDDAFTVAARFARTKLAPIPGAAINLLTGKDVVGNPATLKSEAINLSTPMSMQNIYSIMKANGVPAGAAITLLDMLGMSVQYRDPNAKRKPAPNPKSN